MSEHDLAIRQKLAVMRALCDEVEDLLDRDRAQQPASLPVMRGPATDATPWWSGPEAYETRTGVKNKNPLNVKAASRWQGQTGADGRGHAIFANPIHGVRAALVNLRTYWSKHHLRDLAGIVGRWAPASDTIGSLAGAPPNQPHAYAAWLALRLGVGVKTNLALFRADGAPDDGARLAALVTAMAEYEIGAGFKLNPDIVAAAILAL